MATLEIRDLHVTVEADNATKEILCLLYTSDAADDLTRVDVFDGFLYHGGMLLFCLNAAIFFFQA
ncbi:hypothetical protein, partial [Streptomyces sp. CO7]